MYLYTGKIILNMSYYLLIGLRDAETPNRFTWIDRTAVNESFIKDETFFALDNGQSAEKKKNCILWRVLENIPSTFKRKSCKELHSFICQRLYSGEFSNS